MTSSQSPRDLTLPGSPSGNHRFLSTRWSLVRSAGGEHVLREDQQRALSSLLETYWYPVYAFARRKGHDLENAQDLVQAFFTSLLEKGDLAMADPQRGKFRTFLLTCFTHFAANQWKAEQALKRGGEVRVFSFDQASAEQRYSLEPATGLDAEAAYFASWARALMETVMERLGAEYESTGKRALFAELRGLLAEGSPSRNYADIAGSLGVSEGAVKVAAHRLRKRFGELLRLEISSTLSEPEQFEEELQGLFEALAGGN